MIINSKPYILIYTDIRYIKHIYNNTPYNKKRHNHNK